MEKEKTISSRLSLAVVAADYFFSLRFHFNLIVYDKIFCSSIQKTSQKRFELGLPMPFFGWNFRFCIVRLNARVHRCRVNLCRVILASITRFTIDSNRWNHHVYEFMPKSLLLLTSSCSPVLNLRCKIYTDNSFYITTKMRQRNFYLCRAACTVPRNIVINAQESDEVKTTFIFL